MEFMGCKVTGVKADFADSEIKLTFSLPLNDESQDAAYSLAQYVEKDAGKVDLSIIPCQPNLPGLEVKPTRAEDWEKKVKDQGGSDG